MSFGLTNFEQELIRAVLRHHAEVTEVKIFGSRAKKVSQPNSDVDLALWGNISTSAVAAIAGELDELPLPYTFDVQAYAAIHHRPLREHIDRVGKSFYSREFATAVPAGRREDFEKHLAASPDVPPLPGDEL